MCGRLSDAFTGFNEVDLPMINLNFVNGPLDKRENPNFRSWPKISDNILFKLQTLILNMPLLSLKFPIVLLKMFERCIKLFQFGESKLFDSLQRL